MRRWHSGSGDVGDRRQASNLEPPRSPSKPPNAALPHSQLPHIRELRTNSRSARRRNRNSDVNGRANVKGQHRTSSTQLHSSSAIARRDRSAAYPSMVSVGKLSAGQARYYLDQAATPVSAAQALTSGVEDYYLGGPEAAGRWIGRGARALALEGRVNDAEFEAVLGGTAPATGEPLRRHGSVAGFDVTFSAPKSVSILFGVGDPTIQGAVRSAHDRAVAAAFDYFERSTAFARRGAGGTRVVPGDGLVAASFLHRTSRAGDPQLHTHVVVANAVRAADGRWSALDGRLIYAHARTAGFLYQAQLREELTRTLGLQWTPITKGSAEVRGVPSRVIRAFSRRRAEIEAAMELHGSHGRTAAQVAALDTRRAKDRTRSPEELAPEWRRRAARLNLRQDRIASLRDRSTPEAPSWTDEFAALAAPSGLTRTALIFHPTRRAAGAVRGRTLRRSRRRARTSGRCIPAQPDGRAPWRSNGAALLDRRTARDRASRDRHIDGAPLRRPRTRDRGGDGLGARTALTPLWRTARDGRAADPRRGGRRRRHRRRRDRQDHRARSSPRSVGSDRPARSEAARSRERPRTSSASAAASTPRAFTR